MWNRYEIVGPLDSFALYYNKSAFLNCSRNVHIGYSSEEIYVIVNGAYIGFILQKISFSVKISLYSFQKSYNSLCFKSIWFKSMLTNEYVGELTKILD